MKKSEILRLRNLFSMLGYERTPDQVKNDFGKELNIKEGFLKIKPHMLDLAIKFNEQEITVGDVAKELENRLCTKISIDYAKHLLLMNSVFETFNTF